jgi:hypothetical protein
MSTAAIDQAPALRRALGRWDLTAIGINQVIGGAIFLVPSQVAAQIGAWSPAAPTSIPVPRSVASSASRSAGCNGSRARPARPA